MKALTPLPPSSRCISTTAFSLVEMMAALAIGILLLTFIASMVTQGTKWSSAIQGRLATEHNTKVAMDYLERDFAALTSTELSRTTLTIIPDTITAYGDNISSFWIMLLSRPASTTTADQGTIKAVSYRLRFTDPMTPGGGNDRLVLYRTALSISSTAGPNDNLDTTGALDEVDLHSGFWQTFWSTYENDNGGRTLLDDYLVENVVDIKVRLNYQDNGVPTHFPDPATASTWTSGTANWTPEGFTGVTGINVPNQATSITFTITALRPSGAKRYEDGVMTLEEAILQEGIIAQRTFRIMVN